MFVDATKLTDIVFVSPGDAMAFAEVGFHVIVAGFVGAGLGGDTVCSEAFNGKANLVGASEAMR